MTCLGYAPLTGLVWTIGISGCDLINNLSTQVLNFLSVPIPLLLVAADSGHAANSGCTDLGRV